MKKYQKHGNEIYLEEMKSLQMDVLTVIDKYCQSNGIRYSMACGTLLGAIRHKGYIPWDDDIDIYVPREDYKRLIKEFPKVYEGHYKLSSLERDEKWYIPFAKAYNDDTILIESSLIKEEKGVGIDIFPVDDVPDDEIEWLRYNRRRRFWLKLFVAKCSPLNKNDKFGKKFFRFFIHVLLCFCTKQRWAIFIDKLAQKHNGKGFSRCFECCQGLMQKRPFPKELFNDIVEIPFEDRLFKAFSNSDLYLRNGFGDYMQLPPIEKRVTHHIFHAYWKN